MATRDAEAHQRKERTENASKRRAQLIDATLRSIVRLGLSGTTLASVSEEAGLSQGVAVFYFQNKLGLLGAALRRQYEIYEAHWQKALAAAGDDPVDQIIALFKADFAPGFITEDTLVIWHAFWGEANARPVYGEITAPFEERRDDAMSAACAALLAQEGQPVSEADDIATGIDAMTDGLWLAMYLSNSEPQLEQPMRLAAWYFAAAFPGKAEAFRKGLALA